MLNKSIFFKVSSFEKKVLMIFPIIILVGSLFAFTQGNSIFNVSYVEAILLAFVLYNLRKIMMILIIRNQSVIWRNSDQEESRKAVITYICKVYAGISLISGFLMLVDMFHNSFSFSEILICWSLLAPLVITMNLEEFFLERN